MSLAIKVWQPIALSLALTLTLSVSASEKPDAQQLFKQKCALCHAIDKNKITIGPAISAMSQQKSNLRKVITKGKNMMPAYEEKMTAAQIDALVNYLLANQ